MYSCFTHITDTDCDMVRFCGGFFWWLIPDTHTTDTDFDIVRLCLCRRVCLWLVPCMYSCPTHITDTHCDMVRLGVSVCLWPIPCVYSCPTLYTYCLNSLWHGKIAWEGVSVVTYYRYWLWHIKIVWESLSLADPFSVHLSYTYYSLWYVKNARESISVADLLLVKQLSYTWYGKIVRELICRRSLVYSFVVHILL